MFGSCSMSRHEIIDITYDVDTLFASSERHESDTASTDDSPCFLETKNYTPTTAKKKSSLFHTPASGSNICSVGVKWGVALQPIGILPVSTPFIHNIIWNIPIVAYATYISFVSDVFFFHGTPSSIPYTQFLWNIVWMVCIRNISFAIKQCFIPYARPTARPPPITLSNITCMHKPSIFSTIYNIFGCCCCLLYSKLSFAAGEWNEEIACILQIHTRPSSTYIAAATSNNIYKCTWDFSSRNRSQPTDIAPKTQPYKTHSTTDSAGIEYDAESLGRCDNIADWARAQMRPNIYL